MWLAFAPGTLVKRGEKGIMILAPMIGCKMQRTEEIATQFETQNAADDRKAEPQLYGFRAVYVFDVAQTEGKDLPALTDVQGDLSGYRERLGKFVESQKVTLNYSERIAPAKGLSFGGRITLLSGMQPAEEFSTLVHEIAHEMLHRGERRTLTTKQVRETEAEAVAFVVCQSVGLQTGTVSMPELDVVGGSGLRTLNPRARQNDERGSGAESPWPGVTPEAPKGIWPANRREKWGRARP
jgi:hypothetical protein